MSLPILYKTNKAGKRMYWEIKIEGNELITNGGVSGGKNRRNVIDVRLNKSGRTWIEQALQEAQSRHKKKQQEGYSPDEENTDTREFSPMLAEQANDYIDDLIYPVSVSAKLDGVRASTWLDSNNNIVMKSRKGHDFKFLDKIKESTHELLSSLYKKYPGAILDGELYNHEFKFEKINGISKRTVNPHPEEDQLYYYIFDVYFPKHKFMGFVERINCVIDASYGIDREKYNHYEIHESHSVWSIDSLMMEYHRLLDKGYEGIMVRQLTPKEHSTYQMCRTKNLLKLKPTLDEEGIIIGYDHEVQMNTPLVVWKVVDPRGNKFKLRPRGTYQERSKMFRIAHKCIGKQYTYTFLSLTAQGVPRCPVGLRFRDPIEFDENEVTQEAQEILLREGSAGSLDYTGTPSEDPDNIPGWNTEADDTVEEVENIELVEDTEVDIVEEAGTVEKDTVEDTEAAD